MINRLQVLLSFIHKREAGSHKSWVDMNCDTNSHKLQCFFFLHGTFSQETYRENVVGEILV